MSHLPPKADEDEIRNRTERAFSLVHTQQHVLGADKPVARAIYYSCRFCNETLVISLDADAAPVFHGSALTKPCKR